MSGRQRMAGVRLGLTYGACLAILGLTIAAVTAQPAAKIEAASSGR